MVLITGICLSFYVILVKARAERVEILFDEAVCSDAESFAETTLLIFSFI